MNKGELRKLRKAARTAGEPLTGDLALSGDKNARGDGEFTESPRGRIRAARRQRANDASGDNGLFRLNVGRSHRNVKVEVDCFTGRETEGS